jgi:hypothetical protein
MTAVIERPLVYAAGKPPPFTQQTGDAPAAPEATEQEETEEED